MQANFEQQDPQLLVCMRNKGALSARNSKFLSTLFAKYLFSLSIILRVRCYLSVSTSFRLKEIQNWGHYERTLRVLYIRLNCCVLYIQGKWQRSPSLIKNGEHRPGRTTNLRSRQGVGVFEKLWGRGSFRRLFALPRWHSPLTTKGRTAE